MWVVHVKIRWESFNFLKIVTKKILVKFSNFFLKNSQIYNRKKKKFHIFPRFFGPKFNFGDV
jgi:hypothetical protein